MKFLKEIVHCPKIYSEQWTKKIDCLTTTNLY